jgi:hypothetical protein
VKLDLSIDYDLERFKAYSEKLIKKQAKTELKEIKAKRSISQNSYFHLCVSFFCNHAGYSLTEGKTILKRAFGKFMVYELNGNKFLTSSANIDTLQLTEFIDWIRNIACFENLGVYVPTPEEYIENQYQIDRELQYLK